MTRTINKRMRKIKRTVHQYKPLFMFIGLLLLFSITLIRVTTFVNTRRNEYKINDYGRDKIFINYTVKGGDTIWDIAEDMLVLNPEYNSVRAYVSEVEKLNHRYDNIKAGDTLVLPCYQGKINTDRDTVTLLHRYYGIDIDD